MSSSWRTVSNDFSNTFGGNLTLNLLDRDGDRICIFGFSRGAYTARALAGMIEKVGLLPTGNHQQVPFAYRMYLQDDDEGYSTYPSYDERCSDDPLSSSGWKQSCLFVCIIWHTHQSCLLTLARRKRSFLWMLKSSFSVCGQYRIVSVPLVSQSQPSRDTVASVGIIPRHVPFTKKNTCVKTFRHAISLDEHRVKFKANHFQEQSTVANSELEFQDEFSYTPIIQRLKTWANTINEWFNNANIFDDTYNKGATLQDQYTDQTKKTDVLEVWFSGCHTGKCKNS